MPRKIKPKHRRLIFVVLSLISISAAVSIILSTFRDNLVFFYSPTEIQTLTKLNEKVIRLGGIVEKGSVLKGKDGIISFNITDFNNVVSVTYRGILPDLFREGQGVVVQGIMREKHFEAKEVLAKHDENYMPPEITKAIKKSGHWKGK